MSAKMTCPSCNAHLSSVLRAYEEGDPCPACGLPASAAQAVLEARSKKADAELTEKYEAAVVRVGVLEAEVHLLRRRLEAVRSALKDPLS